MSATNNHQTALPAIKVSGVAYLPLLPGVRAFDVESITSEQGTIRNPTIPKSKRFSRSSLISAYAPSIPEIAPLTSLSDDVFGTAEPAREAASQEEETFAPSEPELERPSTAEMSLYSNKSLPQPPTPAKIFDEVLETITREVPSGQAEYTWRNGYDLDKTPHIPRRGSFDTIFSFGPRDDKDKEAIVSRWRARADKRANLNVQTLVDERKQREEQLANSRIIAKSAEAKKNYRRKRTSRTLGTLGAEPAK